MSFFFTSSILPSLTILFSSSTTGVTVHSASLSSSSSISVSLEFTFYKLLASLAGEHGKYCGILCFLHILLPLLERAGARKFMLGFLFCFVFYQWLDCSFNWPKHQYPSGYHHVTDRSSVYCAVCGLAHHV